ncbi:hypothetical protein AC579_6334 [Pseudocercospora musae]|uniref:BTB domain-containing protein n=1 Tax=Pseudocercospora musae TaxID=113226 RepID=A0A139GTE1_9PEZI|nr:hypothetical protein AC579_6334 [Pseudocercospora musae]
MAEAAAALGRQLKSDRLVKLFVGKDNDEPYLIPQSRLKEASEYFVSAIKHEGWGRDNVGKLHFPDEEKDVFEILIYFIVNGSPPAFTDQDEQLVMQKLLISCWVTADQYLIRDLQDQLMIKLLETLEGATPVWEVVRWAFMKGSEGSKIWRLFAEEAVYKTYERLPVGLSKPRIVESLEQAISGIPGGLFEFLETRERIEQDTDCSCRLRKQSRVEPFLFGSFQRGSKARMYLNVLRAARGASDGLVDDE